MQKSALNFGSITVHSLGLQDCLLNPQQLCQGIGIRSLFSITRFVFLFSNPLCTCSVSWPSPACDSVLLGSSWRVFQFCSCLNYLANLCGLFALDSHLFYPAGAPCLRAQKGAYRRRNEHKFVLDLE